MIALAFVASLPITAMAGTIAWQDYQAITRVSQERAALLEGQALAQFHVAIGSAAERLMALALRLKAGACDPAALSLFGDGIDGIVSMDLDGAVQCRSPGVPVPDQPVRWFEQIRGGMAVSVGTAAGAAGGRIPVVAVRAGPGLVAAASIRPAWLVTQALPDVSEDGAATWLLDENRAVLASRGQAAPALPSFATMVRLIGAKQITLRARSAAGMRYAYASTLLPGGWRLITATSSAHEYALGIRELILRLVELAILLSAGLTAIVLGADVAFGHPLRRLSNAVRRWQAGAPFDTGNLAGAPDEVINLANSFRDATGVLRDKQAELERAQQRQELLVLEIHHRVKNNLQVIASLLNLQASRIRVPEARAEFQAARDRVRALATLHRHLYADGGLHTINMRSLLTELCGQLFQAMGEKEGDRIQLLIEAPELRMSSDQAVPLALIVTEAVTNSVKYAFPSGRTGHISVTLKAPDEALDRLDLVISDDGIGIPAGRQETESGTRDGIGLHLIHGFARQLGAVLTIEDEGRGTRYAVRLSPQVPVALGREPALDAALAGRDNAA